MGDEIVGPEKVVSIEFEVRERGTVLDGADRDNPLVYLHGARNIVPGLERALEGKAVGDRVEVTVSPGQGYGERRKMKPLSIRRSELPHDMKVERGARLLMRGPEGQMIPLWVIKVQGPTVLADANHPMAGKSLDFTASVLDVRDATEEELAHGHVHGPGGHDHS